MMPRSLNLLAGAALAGSLVAGCSYQGGSEPLYDGVAFRTSAAAVDKRVSLADFVVEVRDAPRSLSGARKAAHHEGTRYCVENYGSSRISWQADPLNAEAPMVLDGDTAVYRGVCTP